MDNIQMEQKQFIDDIKTEQKRYIGIAIQINLAFWTSLIAINGITIAGFSIIATSYNFNLLLSSIVITPSVISCFLIINNFLLAKQQYEILNSISDNIQEITDEQKEKNRLEAEKKHKIIEKNNNTVIKLIISQVIFFVLIISFFILFPNFINLIFMKNFIPPTDMRPHWHASFHCPQ
ncbi:MAG: hypothetical protein WC310_05385 [Patescibacteria group bacterium]|jgi:Mn2+/Fe2+ NRAMP family transporter